MRKVKSVRTHIGVAFNHSVVNSINQKKNPTVEMYEDTNGITVKFETHEKVIPYGNIYEYDRELPPTVIAKNNVPTKS